MTRGLLVTGTDTGVGKIVEYLEVFYEEDQQLYRSLDNSLKWVPQPLELSSRGWIKLKLAGGLLTKIAPP